MKNKSKILGLTQGALVGAIYVVLSLIPPLNSISYGPVQFRLSEALMLLCLLSPSCIFGVSAGCFLSNLFSPYGANLFDLILGTLATIIAALITYYLRNFFAKNKFTKLLSPLPTILSNALIVGSYLPFISGAGSNLVFILYCIITVAIGETTVLYFLGLPLYHFSKKKHIFK